MDFRKFGGLLATAGLVLVVVALIWWSAYYSSTGTKEPKLSCLFATGAECIFIYLFGGPSPSAPPPYQPLVVWLGLIALGLGLAIRASATKAPQ
jgi:hypothetical protein